MKTDQRLLDIFWQPVLASQDSRDRTQDWLALSLIADVEYFACSRSARSHRGKHEKE